MNDVQGRRPRVGARACFDPTAARAHQADARPVGARHGAGRRRADRLETARQIVRRAPRDRPAGGSQQRAPRRVRSEARPVPASRRLHDRDTRASGRRRAPRWVAGRSGGAPRGRSSAAPSRATSSTPARSQEPHDLAGAGREAEFCPTLLRRPPRPEQRVQCGDAQEADLREVDDHYVRGVAPDDLESGLQEGAAKGVHLTDEDQGHRPGLGAEDRGSRQGRHVDAVEAEQILGHAGSSEAASPGPGREMGAPVRLVKSSRPVAPSARALGAPARGFRRRARGGSCRGSQPSPRQRGADCAAAHRCG